MLPKQKKTRDVLGNSLGDITARFCTPCPRGGVDSIQNALILLRLGAGKIVGNTNLFFKGTTLPSLLREFGSQCAVAAVDMKKIAVVYRVYSENGSRLEEPILGYDLETAADLGQVRFT
jgi:imidazole glycerol phosphate synthase subunit HisF